MPGDYLSWEEAMAFLGMTPENLNQMVTRGDIKAFRDDKKVKFRRADLDRIRNASENEPTIILPPEGAEPVKVEEIEQDETHIRLDADIPLASEESSQTVVPTIEVAAAGDDTEAVPVVGEETGVRDATEVDETASRAAVGDEAAADGGADVTQEVEGGATEAADDDAAMTVTASVTSSRLASVSGAAGRPRSRRHTLFTVILVVAALFMVYVGTFFVYMVKVDPATQQRGMLPQHWLWTMWGDIYKIDLRSK
ncbi:MAG: helix-turn-helix domain-containing protein [Planctomycetota bacterium]